LLQNERIYFGPDISRMRVVLRDDKGNIVNLNGADWSFSLISTHYSLQLNTYKTILEQKYGTVIRDMFLVCLHPDNANKSYLKIKVADLSEEMRALFKY